MMLLGIIVLGGLLLLLVVGLLIGLSGNTEDSKNIGYKNKY